MLIFGLYKGERITLDVSVGMTVKDVREMIQNHLNISVDQYKHDKKVLVLSWAGSDLQDPWIFSDLGIVPGTTIRVNLKEEVKAVLFIRCSHSQDTIGLYEYLSIGHMQLDELRSVASHKTGLPVGIFRLVNKAGMEMYDGHLLEDYGVDVGDTISLENLDGWNEFINLAVMGFTPQVVSQISQEEITGRYQMKVTLFLAAHFGHVDLARSMLRQGIKASEPIGYPPQRMWCTEDGHIESKKAAVHQAVVMGHLGVLRLFVNTDITVITAKDGNGLAPLNIALRRKVKNCASFLLTKQWSKVNITKTFALHIGTYTHLKQWCERAKERAFVKFGHSKSSLKRRPFQPAPLVGFGVNVDGYSSSIMTGKSKAQLQRERDREKKKLPRQWQFVPQISVAELAGSASDPEAYFKQVNAVQNLKAMGDKVKGKWGRFTKSSSKSNLAYEALTARSDPKTQRTPEPPKTGGGDQPSGDSSVRLPPIMQKLRQRLLTQSQLSTISNAATTSEDQSQQQQQQLQHVPAPPPGSSGGGAGGGGGEAVGEKREEKSMMSKLVKSRGNAYFMAGAGQNAPTQQNPAGPKVPNLNIPDTARSGLGDGHTDPPSTARPRPTVTYRQSLESVDSASTVTDDTGGRVEVPHPQTGGGHTGKKDIVAVTTGRTDVTGNPTSSKQTVIADDATTESGYAVGGGAGRSTNRSSTKKKRASRVTSALLLSKAKASEGAIPLPLISNEQDRRPFFYYNGLREDDIIDPTISNWSKHSTTTGSTPRERAIKSLSVANTFKEKPWLGQVRIALKIASNPTKRSVRRLRSASKRTFAI